MEGGRLVTRGVAPGQHRPGRGGHGRAAQQWATRVAVFVQGWKEVSNGWDHDIVPVGSQTDSNFVRMVSNQIQIHSNFDRSKHDFPKLKKFEIKYGFQGFDERNNFIHKNVFRFKVDFE
jgi:hypothetical protein